MTCTEYFTGITVNIKMTLMGQGGKESHENSMKATKEGGRTIVSDIMLDVSPENYTRACCH